MPIARYLDNLEWDSFPKIGTLRKGSPQREHQGRKIQGTDLDHFRIDFPEENAHLAELWHSLYGDKPKRFDGVYFMDGTLDRVFSFWKMEHTATKLLHKCDGETQHRWFDNDTGQYSNEPIACVAPACGCKDRGLLRLYFPEFIQAAGVIGYIALNTGSFYDIKNLLSCLNSSLRLYGRLNGIPFTLGRAPRKVPVPNPKKPGERILTTKSLLYLQPSADFVRGNIEALTSGQAAAPALASPAEVGNRAAIVINSGSRDMGSVMHGRYAQRRIGAPKNESSNVSTVSNGQDGQMDNRENSGAWALDDQKWGEIVEFAKRLDYNEEELLYVLNAYAEMNGGVVETRNDVLCSQTDAAAAIIAAAHSYDWKAITEYINGNHGSPELLAAATRIVRIMTQADPQ